LASSFLGSFFGSLASSFLGSFFGSFGLGVVLLGILLAVGPGPRLVDRVALRADLDGGGDGGDAAAAHAQLKLHLELVLLREVVRERHLGRRALGGEHQRRGSARGVRLVGLAGPEDARLGGLVACRRAHRGRGGRREGAPEPPPWRDLLRAPVVACVGDLGLLLFGARREGEGEREREQRGPHGPAVYSI
jgi:hypothetical protein